MNESEIVDNVVSTTDFELDGLEDLDKSIDFDNIDMTTGKHKLDEEKHETENTNDIREEENIENTGGDKKRQHLEDNRLDSLLDTSDLDTFLKAIPVINSIEGTPEVDGNIELSKDKDQDTDEDKDKNMDKEKDKDKDKDKDKEKEVKSEEKVDNIGLEMKNISKDSSINDVESKINNDKITTVNENIPKSKPKKKHNSYGWNRNDEIQPVDENGIPLDIVKAREYLNEKFEKIHDVNLSNSLLQKKQEEDEGIQGYSESDSEEDFEDLLEIFDINPDEMSLDLSLNEKRKLLIDNMDDNQLKRYEFFRRTNLNIGGIKKLINSITGVSVTSDFAKLLGGVGKVFVGDIVEMAKIVQREESESRVSQQILYKNELQKYEKELIKFNNKKEKEKEKEKENDKDNDKDNEDQILLPKKPIAPSFYETLLQLETGASLVSIRRRVDTFNNFRVVIPRETAQLTPDHVREAWRRIFNDNNSTSGGVAPDVTQKWRMNGSKKCLF